MKLKRHHEYGDTGLPLCHVKAEGALVVTLRAHVTCERCKKLFARILGDAATVVLQ